MKCWELQEKIQFTRRKISVVLLQNFNAQEVIAFSTGQTSSFALNPKSFPPKNKAAVRRTSLIFMRHYFFSFLSQQSVSLIWNSLHFVPRVEPFEWLSAVPGIWSKSLKSSWGSLRMFSPDTRFVLLCYCNCWTPLLLLSLLRLSSLRVIHAAC